MGFLGCGYSGREVVRVSLPRSGSCPGVVALVVKLSGCCYFGREVVRVSSSVP